MRSFGLILAVVAIPEKHAGPDTPISYGVTANVAGSSPAQYHSESTYESDLENESADLYASSDCEECASLDSSEVIAPSSEVNLMELDFFGD